jgi:hypothetical protein
MGACGQEEKAKKKDGGGVKSGAAKGASGMSTTLPVVLPSVSKLFVNTDESDSTVVSSQASKKTVSRRIRSERSRT